MSAPALSRAEARRLAVAAQGFTHKRAGGRVDIRHVRRVFEAVRVIQIDFVNVLVPAHYQVLCSRIGPYDRSRLDEAVYDKREFTEAWGHEASLVPVEHWPYLRVVNSQDRRAQALAEFRELYPGYVDEVLAAVRDEGPITASAAPEPAQPLQRRDEWGWTMPKTALEALFVAGEIAVTRRLEDQSREFDLAERVLPKQHATRQVEPDEAHRALMLEAALACGIAAPADLADYYRLPVTESRERITELVEDGALEEVTVEGWREPGVRHPGVELPDRIRAAALLSPFDPLIWCRPRVERVFGMDYKAEIFVPRPKRRWGYYVLPFLLNDELVARVDLKADRKGSKLSVESAHLEKGADGRAVAGALAEELAEWAEWLELEEVDIGRRGALTVPLAAAVDG